MYVCLVSTYVLDEAWGLGYIDGMDAVSSRTLMGGYCIHSLPTEAHSESFLEASLSVCHRSRFPQYPY